MAITTDGKINEMYQNGKADKTIQEEYNKLKHEHNLAKNTKVAKKIALDNAKINWEAKTQKMSDISLLHPIKKYRAYKEMVAAKNRYRILKQEYKISKQILRASQRKLRAMRAEVRQQYRSVKQNEKMIKRVKAIQQGHYANLSLQDVVEYNKHIKFYNNAKYHVDRNNFNNNTFVSPPWSELYKNINNAYANHLMGKAKQKVNDTKAKVLDVTRHIGDRFKKYEPEVGM